MILRSKYISYIICVFVSFHIFSSSSLSTAFCDHRQFEGYLLKSLECWNDYSNNEVKTLFSNDTEEEIVPGCETVEKVTSCFVDNVGACFAQEQNADGILLINFAFSNYGNDTRCERNGGVVRTIIEDNVKNMFMKYLTYTKNEEVISSIFTLDSKCTLDEILVSLHPEQICLTRLPLMVQTRVESINNTLENAKETIKNEIGNNSHASANNSDSFQGQSLIYVNTSGIKNTTTTKMSTIWSNLSSSTKEQGNGQSIASSSTSSGTDNGNFDQKQTTVVNNNKSSVLIRISNMLENQSFPLCKAIDDTLHCIRPSDCVSMREINLFKKVIFKIYKIGMDHGKLLVDKLGGVEEFYGALGIRNFSKVEAQPIVPAIIQLSLNDFKVKINNQ